jgi:hypothetical protein
LLVSSFLTRKRVDGLRAQPGRLHLASKVAANWLANSIKDRANLGRARWSERFSPLPLVLLRSASAQRQKGMLATRGGQAEAHPVSKQVLAAAQDERIDQQAIFVDEIVLC